MSLTVAEIMSKIPAAFAPEKATDMNAVVHFKFTGAEAGEWNAVIRDGRCDIAQGIPRSKPSVSLTADSSDFVRIVLGEMDGMKAVMDGKLKVSGDILLAPRLLQAFRVPGM